MKCLLGLKVFLGLSILSQADTITLFDGKSLDGWVGDARFWSVRDGVITGKSTESMPCKKSTFLVYKKQEFENFELTLSFRFLTEYANGGILYRSKWQDQKNYRLTGYQADLATEAKFNGILYESGGRKYLAQRGEKVTIDAKGKKKVTALADPLEADKAQKSIKHGEWNEYRVVADGTTLIHQINGHTTIEVEDNEENRAQSKGWLALQLHSGVPVTVQYKDVRMLELVETHLKSDAKSKGGKSSAASEQIQAMDGFKVEKIYTVDKEKEGSWVAMCFDDKGNLFVSDQYGSLYRITLKDGIVATKTKLKSIGYAQGLCWAYDSLYVVSSKKGNSGVHRLTDTNNDGEFDKSELILPISGRGEHGTHGIIENPNGEGLLLVVGNHTHPPKDATSLSNGNWAEDTLHPHLNDASGHAVGRKAPAGTLILISPDGKQRRIIARGMRNTYDVAASPTGEIFGYDSDMEYDVGTPWYKPTRLLHMIEGAEFGWRTGTAKWPEYYADSLGSVIDVGPGCPTGVAFGTRAKFPAKYQKALFIQDWTFGRIYALHLQADGVSYTADKEVFVSGKPLPLTDMAIGPDGNMYFLTGGRRLRSGLYRVSYTGDESTVSVSAEPVSKSQKLRKRVQKIKKAERLWKYLGRKDRVLRYTARVSLELIPAEKWLDLYKAETDPQSLITASIALARKEVAHELILEQLLKIDFDNLDEAMQLEYLRAVSLVCIRSAKPSGELRARFLDKFKTYPSGSRILNRELCRVLVYLDSETVLNKTLFLMNNSVVVKEEISEDLLAGHDKYGKDIMNMLENQPDAQGLHYALMLKNQKSGWDKESVLSYYQWLVKAESKTGGNSYKGFIKNIRAEAMERLSPELAKFATKVTKDHIKHMEESNLEEMPIAKGPGRSWTMKEAVVAVNDLSSADKVNGKKMFKAILCVECHTRSGVGGSSGPELTQLANRFTKEDILKAIIHPSEVISDQYTTTDLQMKKGSTVSGKIMKEDDEFIHLAINPFDLTVQIKVRQEDVEKRSKSTVSTMPPSLINALSEQELKDLMLFLTESN